MFGIVVLTGIVVNDSIVLIDFHQQTPGAVVTINGTLF